MSERRPAVPIPDGYEPAPGGGIQVMEPLTCPTGHPALLIRQDYVRCDEHGGHHAWTCSCSQRIFRHAGEFVGELDCVSPNYGQQI